MDPVLSTAAGRLSASDSDTGGAVDISEVNGIAIAGHEGAGSITDSTIRTLLTLQGEYVPNQITSLMKYPDAANTFATRAHGNAVQIDFQPPAAALGLSGAKAAKAARTRPPARTRPRRSLASPTLSLTQWNELLARIGAIPAPKVAAKPTSAAIRDPQAAPSNRGLGVSEQARLLRRVAPHGISASRYPAGGPAAPPGASPLLGGAAPGGAPLALGDPPAPGPRRNAPLRSLWHLVSAALNWALLVSMPLVSNTGPLPEVFGAGTFTPFSRRQVANFASAVLKAGLLKRAAPPRPAKVPPPHFFSAASYCARVTPFGS